MLYFWQDRSDKSQDLKVIGERLKNKIRIQADSVRGGRVKRSKEECGLSALLPLCVEK